MTSDSCATKRPGSTSDMMLIKKPYRYKCLKNTTLYVGSTEVFNCGGLFRSPTPKQPPAPEFPQLDLWTCGRERGHACFFFPLLALFYSFHPLPHLHHFVPLLWLEPLSLTPAMPSPSPLFCGFSVSYSLHYNMHRLIQISLSAQKEEGSSLNSTSHLETIFSLSLSLSLANSRPLSCSML